MLNACRGVLRRRPRSGSVRPIVLDDPELPPVAAADGEVLDAARFDRAVERSAVEQRWLLVAHHVEQRPVGEPAEGLGIPAGTLRSRLHAARQALERALHEEDDR